MRQSFGDGSSIQATDEREIMKSITVDATLENLESVQNFIEQELKENGCQMKVLMQISIAVEEIYVNIAHYAYNPEIGKATIFCSVEGEPLQVTLEFLDNGHPFDPLAVEDADTTLPAGERKIGGLGILLVKKSMDQLSYAYKDGQNILTLKKRI